jgi:hypothetical protein
MDSEVVLRLKALEEKYDLLSKEVEELRDNKNEIYYQRYLEKHLGGYHKVTKYGITDISTETHHIEIKRWKNFKSALGQLVCYNHGDNKQLVVAFFGEYKDKPKIIELFHSKNIEVWGLIKTGDGIEIEKYKTSKNMDFEEWLDQHIKESKNESEYIELKTVCELYLNRSKISSKTSTKYKTKIEEYIKDKFPRIYYAYRQLDSLPSRPRGWSNLQLK